MPPIFFETHEVFAQSFKEEHPHPTLSQQRKLAALRRREEFVYSHAQGVIAITASLREDIGAQYGINTPILVAPDGVDLQLAACANRPTKNSIPTLLYLGSLHSWKGVDTLIRAMVTVKNARLMVGGGNESRIAELRQLAKTLSVADRTTFLGPIDPKERFNTIAQADICLLPSSTTSIGSRFTSPLKLFEYLALGKPIIAGDVPALREILQHEHNALLTPPGDAQACGESINRLLASPALALHIAKQARLTASNFGWDARCRTILDFMKQEPSGHRPATPHTKLL